MEEIKKDVSWIVEEFVEERVNPLNCHRIRKSFPLVKLKDIVLSSVKNLAINSKIIR